MHLPACGGYSNSTKAIKSPDYPAVVAQDTYCIWLISLPKMDVLLNTTVNTMIIDLQMKKSNNTKYDQEISGDLRRILLDNGPCYEH